MTTKNNKSIIKIVSALLISNLLFMSAFANVDVTASLDSGSFNKAIKVELNVTESWAKTFYGFNPDGWPSDVELYTWAIIIKKTTPLVFFSFLTTSNESKIKINNYTINYPAGIMIGSWVFYDNGNLNNLWLVNNSNEDIDISYWVVKNDSSNFVFPENSVIKVWWSYSVTGLNWTGTIALYSPDEVKRDSVEVIIPVVEIVNTWATADTNWNITVENEHLRSEQNIPKPAKPAIKPTKVIENNAPTVDIPKTETPVVETPKVNETPATNTEVAPTTTDTPATNTPTADTPATTTNNETVTPVVSTPATDNNNFNDSIKTSVNETSGWTSGNANYFIFGLLLFSLLGWVAFKFLKIKKTWS